jgi:Flp pilus assembly protein TadG
VGRRTSERGQALVELALIMPLLVGVVAVLFQTGVLFLSYLSLVHASRDVGRWLAVTTTPSVGGVAYDAKTHLVYQNIVKA